MGFLAWLFKGKSAKDIKLKQDISKYLVFPFSPKKNLIWLNHKAVVPEETELCLCARNKVLDFLPTGEHMLGAIIIPNCSKKFKLFKVDKNNKAPDRFKGFAYFINKKIIQDFKFETEKIKYYNEVDGHFTVKMQCSIDFQVENSNKLMRSLLTEFAYLKQYESEKIMTGWLSEYITEELKHGEHRRSEFSEHLDELQELLSAKLEKGLVPVGMKFIALKIPNVIITKKKNKKQENQIISTNAMEAEEAKLEENYTKQEIISNEVFNQSMPSTNPIDTLYQKEVKKEQLIEETSLNSEKQYEAVDNNPILQTNADIEQEFTQIELQNAELVKKSLEENMQSSKKSGKNWQGLEHFWK